MQRMMIWHWHYPGQQGFIYMNQPFEGVKFEVEALNGLNQLVQNYVNFMSQAEFNLAEGRQAGDSGASRRLRQLSPDTA